MMKNLWWKILAMLILLYTVFFGMLVPLKPGIDGLDRTVLKAGQSETFNVSTYNTVYKSDKDNIVPSAYLKIGKDLFLPAATINVMDNRSTSLRFDIPESIPSGDTIRSATLLMTDPSNGSIVYPDGLIITKASPAGNAGAWTKQVPELYKKKGYLFPYRNILLESIRNTFYHIPLWFAMFILFFAAMIQSIIFLRKGDIEYDHRSSSLIYAGILMGVLGLLTGSLWAKDTWGAYWTSDIKLNMTAISMMIYLAYLILRKSIEDLDRKAKISAAYNIFAFFTIVPLIYVVPRLTDSLHPGNGGNPALGGEDMDNTMRTVFYPAIIGFTLLGVWIGQIILRMKRLKLKINDKMLNDDNF